jgi:hypothetical protein
MTKLEQLFIDYDLYEDKRYLTSENDINPFFKDIGWDIWHEESDNDSWIQNIDVYGKIGNDFYKIHLEFYVGRETGGMSDKDYRVLDEVHVSSWKKIEPLKPKERWAYTIEAGLTEGQKRYLENYFEKNQIKFEIS